MEVQSVDDIRKFLEQQRHVPNMRPAKLADLQGLLKGIGQKKFEIGDIVMLRDGLPEMFHWPVHGDRCIVTQVLDTPVHVGDPGSAQFARSYDIALAFVDEDGDLMEYMHDSRLFVRVASIYDPITLPDGEVLPTV